jgi:putative ABC transport system permease protein
MAIIRSLQSFWKNLAHRDRTGQELDEEIRAYTELLEEEKIRSGASPDEARWAARLELGGAEQVKEQVRQVWVGAWLETLLQDLRYGARMLWRDPGFTAVTVLTLALGMGANTAMFSSIDALVLRPLNFPDPDRLVALSETQPRIGFEPENVAPADFFDWTRQSAVFSSLAAYCGWDADLTGAGEPEHLQGARVSPNFFSTVGVSAAFGRTFVSGEDQPGRERVAIISYGLWQRRFLGDPRVLDTDVELSGAHFRIVGVMPSSFNYPLSTNVWTPLPRSTDLVQDREKQSLRVVARLGQQSSMGEARAEMNTVATRLEVLYPRTNAGRRISVALLREHVAGDFTPTFLWIGLGSVLFVLSIACVNVANIQLARAAGRQREMAVRAAIGASRRRIVRQLLTENVLLAFMGGTAGVAVAWGGLRLLKQSMPPDLVQFIPGWQAMAVDARTLGFTLGIALLTGIFFGLAPALAASKPDLYDALKKGAKSPILGGGRHGLRNVLVVSEIALALVLLVGTGLMVKGFRRVAENQKQGFSPENLLTLGTSLATSRYPDDRRVSEFYANSLESIHKLPEVISASAVAYVPSSGAWSTQKLLIEGRPAPAPDESQTANFQIVTPGYFQTLQIPLIQGRDFAGSDRPESQKVAIISAEFARRYLSGADPLGQRIRLGSPPSEWTTIVGVVGDVRRFMFDRTMRATVYLPHAQLALRSMHVMVRTHGDPAQLSSAIRVQMFSVDKDQPIFEVKTEEAIIDEQISGVRVGAGSMAIYGLIALLLSAVGVSGVVAHSAQQRKHEIGIRMAVGAQAGDILRMVLGQTVRLTAIGLTFGLLAAFAMGRVMEKVMFGMIALDFVTFSAFALLLAGIAVFASYIPARSAARVDPMITLRHE